MSIATPKKIDIEKQNPTKMEALDFHFLGGKVYRQVDGWTCWGGKTTYLLQIDYTYLEFIRILEYSKDEYGSR